MEKKAKFHGFYRIFHDILRDNNSTKYSMTKFAVLMGLITLIATFVTSLVIMWKTKEIDHVLFGELIGFILTLLGFKNSFGFNSANKTGISNGNSDSNPVQNSENTQQSVNDDNSSTTVDSKIQNVETNVKQLLCEEVNDNKSEETINDKNVENSNNIKQFS